MCLPLRPEVTPESFRSFQERAQHIQNYISKLPISHPSAYVSILHVVRRCSLFCLFVMFIFIICMGSSPFSSLVIIVYLLCVVDRLIVFTRFVMLDCSFIFTFVVQFLCSFPFSCSFPSPYSYPYSCSFPFLCSFPIPFRCP